MKKILLLFLWILFPIIMMGQEVIDLDKQAPPGDSTWTSIEVTDSLFLTKLATSDVKVMSPTSTGGTTALETVDGSEILYDTIRATTFLLGDITGLHSVSVDLTPAQIQAIETTPIQLVAAQGTHKIIEFVSAMFIWNYVDTDFTVTNADNKFRIQYDGSTDVSEAIDMNTFLEGSADAIRWCLPANTTDTDLLAQENKKLELFNEGTGDVTGGDNSTLTVKITYKVHDTGL